MPFRKSKPWGNTKPPVGSNVDWGDPLNAGLGGCWLFNESSGAILRDLTGHANGAITAPLWKPGKFGTTLFFDGSTTLVNIGHPTLYDRGSGDYSLSVWIKPTALIGVEEEVFACDQDTGRQFGLLIDNGLVANNIVLVEFNGASYAMRYSQNVLVQGAWQHVVWTKKGTATGAASIYINGVSVPLVNFNGDFSTPMNTTTSPIQMGHRSYPGNPNWFTGGMEGMRYWTRAISDAEVKRLYAEPFAGIQTTRRRITSSTGAGTQGLTPGLFTNSNTFYAPTVAAGAVGLTPGLVTNSNTFYAPTVSLGGVTQTLTPSLFTNSNAFYSPTVAPGAVALTPSLFSNTNTFYAPTVAFPTQALTPSLFSNSNTFYSPTVAPGAVALTPGLFSNTNIFYSPTVAGGLIVGSRVVSVVVIT